MYFVEIKHSLTGESEILFGNPKNVQTIFQTVFILMSSLVT